MIWYATKTLISAAIIVAVTEIAKRAGTFWGAVLASLPLVSLLAFVWLYVETRDAAKIGALSWSVFWMVIPSLVLFAALPILLKKGAAFPLALLLSCAATAVAYIATVALLRRFGISL